MTNVINLRKARKRMQRATQEKTAERNRAKHGRTKAERELEKAKAARSERLLDAHRIDPKEPR